MIRINSTVKYHQALEMVLKSCKQLSKQQNKQSDNPDSKSNNPTRFASPKSVTLFVTIRVTTFVTYSNHNRSTPFNQNRFNRVRLEMKTEIIVEKIFNFFKNSENSAACSNET